MKITFDQFIALLHAFLAIVTTWTAVMTVRNRSKIQQINIAINSRMDELLKSATGLARAQGKEEGRNENKT